MNDNLPVRLTALLQRLGLASAGELAAVAPAVRRLAGELPQFESVWIDALRQARLLTQFQAAEISAGRGDSLLVGPYVLSQTVLESGFATVYRAVRQESRETVRLAVFAADDDVQAPGTSHTTLALEKLATAAVRLPHVAGLINHVGEHGGRFWAASPWVEGSSLADWMLHHGRFPPEVVLEIARAMLDTLAQLEAAGLAHGDIRPQTVLVAPDGAIGLPHAGLRAILRPNEGVPHSGIVPDACGTLAPERVAGQAASPVTDLFSCGCAWWHILCGRPPLGGGDILTRLQAAQSASIDDLRQWTTDVPESLESLVRDCVSRDPGLRPASMSVAAGRLGPLRRSGRRTIVRCLESAGRPRAPWLESKRTRARRDRAPRHWIMATLGAMAVLAIAWPLWVAGTRSRLAGDPGSRSVAASTAGSVPAMVADPPPTARRLPRPGDDHVVPVGFDAPMPSDPAAGKRSADRGVSSGPKRPSYDLPIDRPVLVESLKLAPGLRVRAAEGRARVVVPARGYRVEADRVCFENIDFVFETGTGDTPDVDPRGCPGLRILAAECEFHGCSFQSMSDRGQFARAIVWTHGTAEPRGDIALPTGRIRFRDCVFRRVAAGIESDCRGAVAVEADNLLHLGPGPMLRLAHFPKTDEPVRLRLSQVTIREAESLLECQGSSGLAAAGEIRIQAVSSVLAPRAGSSLVVMAGEDSPDALVRELRWTGRGCVLPPQVAFGHWLSGDGGRQTINDTTIPIEGLVRGEVEFAGSFDGSPANSRVLGCQAPLQDSESPGAATAALPPEVVDISAVPR